MVADTHTMKSLRVWEACFAADTQIVKTGRYNKGIIYSRRPAAGVRRITAKVKTVICEQAPNHGSYFAYAWLCFRNSQLFAILQQIQRLRDNGVRVAFFQFLAVTEAPEDTYGEGACRLAGLHVCGGISHVEYFVCGETEPV